MLRVDQLAMFGDRVLVDPDAKHERSEGGLHIPPAVLRDNPNYYNMTGIVVALGDGVMRHTFQCLNCLALAPQDEGPCPGCHQPLGNKNTRLYEADPDRYAFAVAVGDRVLFNRFAGKQIELEEAWLFRRPLRPSPHGNWLEEFGDFTVPDYAVRNEPKNWLDETPREQKRHARNFLIMRESEILGVVDGDHRITPGYQAPKAGRVTEGLTL